MAWYAVKASTGKTVEYFYTLGSTSRRK